MKKFRSYNWRTPVAYARGNAPVNITNNITNITSVTNVTRVTGAYGGFARKHHGRKNAKRHADRPPKLQRFCATGGLLDYKVAARMDSAELCVEAAKVVGYNAKGLARDVGNICGGVCDGVAGMLCGTVDLVRGIVGLFK